MGSYTVKKVYVCDECRNEYKDLDDVLNCCPKKKKFSEKQLEDIEKIKDILIGFKCNEECILDCSDRCPFKIKGKSPIHKDSEGCLHHKLSNILFVNS